MSQAAIPTQYCGHCGAPVAPGMSFCGRCGTALPSATATAPPAAATVEGAAGAVPPAAAPPPTATAPPAAPPPTATAPPAAAPGPPPAAVPPSVAGAAAMAARPIACPRCGALNSASARFCGRCAQPLAFGAAVAPVGVAGATAPAAYPFAAAPVRAALPHKAGRGIPWYFFGAAIGIAVLVLAVVSRLLTPTPPPPCGVRCTPPPPSSPPLPAQNLYTSTAYGYSLEYSANLAPATQDATSVGWQLSTSSGNQFTVDFAGASNNGQGPDQIVQSLQQTKYPDAKVVYQIPQAELGYSPGYGAVYDASISPPSGQAVEARIIIEAAVKKGVAITMIGAGPMVPDTQGHPNPAQTPISQFCDTIANTVLWKGDAPL